MSAKRPFSVSGSRPSNDLDDLSAEASEAERIGQRGADRSARHAGAKLLPKMLARSAALRLRPRIGSPSGTSARPPASPRSSRRMSPKVLATARTGLGRAGAAVAGARCQTRADAVHLLAAGASGQKAGQWEPCEPRGSHTVLREPRGESPLSPLSLLGYSPRLRPSSETTVLPI